MDITGYDIAGGPDQIPYMLNGIIYSDHNNNKEDRIWCIVYVQMLIVHILTLF